MARSLALVDSGGKQIVRFLGQYIHGREWARESLPRKREMLAIMRARPPRGNGGRQAAFTCGSMHHRWRYICSGKRRLWKSEFESPRSGCPKPRCGSAVPVWESCGKSLGTAIERCVFESPPTQASLQEQKAKKAKKILLGPKPPEHRGLSGRSW